MSDHLTPAAATAAADCECASPPSAHGEGDRYSRRESGGVGRYGRQSRAAGSAPAPTLSDSSVPVFVRGVPSLPCAVMLKCGKSLMNCHNSGYCVSLAFLLCCWHSSANSLMDFPLPVGSLYSTRVFQCVLTRRTAKNGTFSPGISRGLPCILHVHGICP